MESQSVKIKNLDNPHGKKKEFKFSMKLSNS